MHIDLNLLTALDALLEEGSVGGAAERLHLSQPAMSRTLARIRVETGDGILVRSGRSMVPTPYAVAVRDRVHALVEQARAVLSPERELHLDELDATFTLRCHDALTNALAPRLIARVQREAPNVRLRFLAESESDEDGLRSGRTDVEIGSAPGATADIASTTIGSGGMVVVMRPEHPLAAESMTVRRFARADHVIVSRRGRLDDPIDALLAEAGESRRVVASAPTSTAALRIASGTDALVIVPESVCAADVAAYGLVAKPLPFEMPDVAVVMNWHVRHNDDAAHRWLRSLVAAELGTA
ncbi:LysR family transcriptional regulator [Plantibacter sp. YIM 135249]|uniref:LysR family transcriptional regulator n=1 Tax=Plantibacter sp. YIM 135249 TaxID=3423918 RepID=UPI003D34ADC7